MYYAFHITSHAYAPTLLIGIQLSDPLPAIIERIKNFQILRIFEKKLDENRLFVRLIYSQGCSGGWSCGSKCMRFPVARFPVQGYCVMPRP
jgi:hypothetical protein